MNCNTIKGEELAFHISRLKRVYLDFVMDLEHAIIIFCFFFKAGTTLEN